MTSEETATEQATRAGWPYVLIKAITDEFDYVLKTKSGESYCFARCMPSDDGKWVCLLSVTSHSAACETSEDGKNVPPTFERGVYIPVDSIALVADAPWGS